jgi:hypothetical protein
VDEEVDEEVCLLSVWTTAYEFTSSNSIDQQCKYQSLPLHGTQPSLKNMAAL